MKKSTCLGIAIGILIIIILISINYSYNTKEGFEDITYTDLIKTINNNKTRLQEVRKALQKLYLKYPNDPAKINSYIDASDIIKANDKQKLKQEFNLNFLQHLQDKEISKLEEDLKYLQEKKQANGNTNNNKLTKGLKGITSGAVLGVVYKDNKQYDFISKPKFSLVMDKNKQSCAKYTPSKKINNDGEVETVKEVGCDYDINANQQKFSYQKIDGNKSFNNALHPDFKHYAVAEDYYRLNNYPFYLVHPYNKMENGSYDVDKKECLTLNADGLSVEPCVVKETQRFLLSDL